MLDKKDKLEDIFSELFQFTNSLLDQIKTLDDEKRDTDDGNKYLLDLEIVTGRYYGRLSSEVKKFYRQLIEMPAERRKQFFLDNGIQADLYARCIEPSFSHGSHRFPPMQLIMLLFLVDKYPLVGQYMLWSRLDALPKERAERYYKSFKKLDEGLSLISFKKTTSKQSLVKEVQESEGAKADEPVDVLAKLASNQQKLASAHASFSLLAHSRTPSYIDKDKDKDNRQTQAIAS